jgi:hypothetical protein
VTNACGGNVLSEAIAAPQCLSEAMASLREPQGKSAATTSLQFPFYVNNLNIVNNFKQN